MTHYWLISGTFWATMKVILDSFSLKNMFIDFDISYIPNIGLLINTQLKNTISDIIINDMYPQCLVEQDPFTISVPKKDYSGTFYVRHCNST